MKMIKSLAGCFVVVLTLAILAVPAFADTELNGDPVEATDLARLVDVEPVDTDTVTYIVAFDPDDDITQYPDFHKITVPAGEKIPKGQIPANPKREGFIFGGWYYALNDETDQVILWNFDRDVVTGNTTLWANWEYQVAFDPDDGVSQYPDFHKISVRPGHAIAKSQLPADPKKEGFVFAGWYHTLNEATGDVILWDLERDTVEANTTLWASWKKTETSGSTDTGSKVIKGRPGSGSLELGGTQAETTAVEDAPIPLQSGEPAVYAPNTGAEEPIGNAMLSVSAITCLGLAAALLRRKKQTH